MSCLPPPWESDSDFAEPVLTTSCLRTFPRDTAQSMGISDSSLIVSGALVYFMEFGIYPGNKVPCIGTGIHSQHPSSKLSVA